MKMKQDKYSGYWLIKEPFKYFIKVVEKGPFPRRRRVIDISLKEHIEESATYYISVDWLRLHGEKITEKEFKYATRR